MSAVPVSRFTVRPGRPLAGSFAPPGDKSITHRAFLLGLLADGETVVENANPGDDGRATLRCAEALGARVAERDGLVRITGAAAALREPDHVLDCGNSGTTLRLLAGVLAGQPLFAVLNGDASLNRRPVARIVTPLRRMGAMLTARDGDRLPPLAIRGGALSGTTFDEPTASAQVASCILLAGLQAGGRTSVRTQWGVRNHTSTMLPLFQVPVETERETAGPTRITIEGPVVPRAARVHVPGDFSAAAFFLAAAAITPGARVTARGVNLNATRTGLARALADMGAAVETRETGRAGEEPWGDVTVTGPDVLRATDLDSRDVPSMIDEVPIWAMVAACALGTSHLTGAADLRVKESDRIATLASNLARLGITVEETPDGLAITGGRARGGTIDAAGDHRIAMAFAVLATRAEAPITIDGAEGIPTSYPGFTGTLAALGGEIGDMIAVERA